MGRGPLWNTGQAKSEQLGVPQGEAQTHGVAGQSCEVRVVSPCIDALYPVSNSWGATAMTSRSATGRVEVETF